MNAHASRDYIEPPSALSAEQALLGAILHTPDVLDRVRGLVEADDFAEDLHAAIYGAMCERRDQGGMIDAHLIRLTIGDRDLGGITVGEYLARLFGAATTIVNAPDYARAIRHAAMMRSVLATAQDAVAAMTTGAVTDPSGYAAGMIESLDAVAASGTAAGLRRVSLGEASRQAINAAYEAREGRAPRGAPTGIPSIDRMTLGLRPGQLIILAGRPGMGKTTAAVSFSLAASRAGHGTYVVSLEMVAQELAERALAAMCFSSYQEPITYRDIVEGRRLSDDDFARLIEAQERLARLPYEIEQQAGLTVSQIIARARQVKARWERRGVALGAIFVDHLGLIKPSKRYAGNRVQEITEITGTLKEAAKELGAAVVALCQLSRQVEGRDDKRPTLSDLRDSGSIEQDADTVIGLYREAYYLRRKNDRTEAEESRLIESENTLDVEILKQRQGPTGQVRLFCSVNCNVIAEMPQ